MPSFEIDYNGTSETIEFLDDLAWGDTQKILKASVDISNPQSININIQLYQQMVLQAAITKAPFDVKNLTTLNKLPSKVVNKIMSEVMKVFPLDIGTTMGDGYDRTGLNRVSDEIYVYCALVFKWDQEQVDRQSTKYLKRIVVLSQERINDTLKSIFRG